MSASSFTDWQISCNHPGCSMHVWGSELETRDVTAAKVREILAKRGWTVNIPASKVPGRHLDRRLDFCPRHKPGEVGQ